jgi:hypothetical protein
MQIFLLTGIFVKVRLTTSITGEIEMKLRVDYTAGSIFDLANDMFEPKQDHALVWNKEQALDVVREICCCTKSNPEDFEVTNLQTGKKFRFRNKSQ